ncbi:14366_t:CDS:2, partial [Acaulospora colombiana]
ACEVEEWLVDGRREYQGPKTETPVIAKKEKSMWRSHPEFVQWQRNDVDLRASAGGERQQKWTDEQRTGKWA